MICFMNRRRGRNSREIKVEVSCMALALHTEINDLSHKAPPLTWLTHREFNSRAIPAGL